jgi:16S rRNA (uracil1498-N3)-methyltransferase
VSAHHFFVEPSAIGEGVVVLDGEEAHHAARVLRVRVGEQITIADGSGRMISASVTDVGDLVTAEILATTTVPASVPEITLFQSLTKKDRFDLVIEKATEVGVRRIIPVTSERTVVDWDERKRDRMADRWAQIARAAAKQSRAPRIPSIGEVSKLDAFLAFEGTRIALHESASRRLRGALPAGAPAHLALLVGPEGGLSPAEAERLSAGSDVASLGPRVLRTETAGVVAAAIIAHVYGSLG